MVSTKPTCPFRHRRKHEIDDIEMSVVHDQQGCIRSPPPDPAFLGATVQQHAEAANIVIVPLLDRHFRSGRRKPGDVLDIQLLIVRADDETAAKQNGKSLSDSNQLSCKLSERAALGIDLEPGEPGRFVVLSVSIIIPMLSVAKLVAGQQHRGCREKTTRSRADFAFAVPEC